MNSYILKKSSIFHVFLITLFLSCTQQTDTRSNSVNLFTMTNTLKIPVDENISAIGNYYNFHNDNIDKDILIIPSVNNELYYFDIDKHLLMNKVKFQEEGPDGVGTILRINQIANDSIIIIGNSSMYVYLTNSKGIKLKTFSMKGHKELEHRGIVGLPRTNLLNYKKNIIAYADINLLKAPNSDKVFYDLDSKAFTILNLNTSIFSLLPIKYPLKMTNREEYWDTFHFTPSYDLMGDILYYTFPGCDSLYAYNLKTNHINQVLAKSIHEPDKDNIITKQIRTIKELHTTYALNCSYFKVLTDKYNNKIYRIIGHPTENWKDSGNLNDICIAKPCSIQVFDSTTLKFLGETEIYPQNSFDFIDSFVGKKGLYISNNHPQNIKTNEETLSYTIFSLKK